MARLDAARGRDRAALDHARAAAAPTRTTCRPTPCWPSCCAAPAATPRRDAVLARVARRATRSTSGPATSPAWTSRPTRPTLLDVALEYDSLGAWRDAVRLLEAAAEAEPALGQVEVRPLAHLHAARILDAGRRARRRRRGTARWRAPHPPCTASPRASTTSTCCRRTSASHPDDARAWAILGHWLYFQRRHDDAIAAWRTSTRARPERPRRLAQPRGRGVQRPGRPGRRAGALRARARGRPRRPSPRLRARPAGQAVRRDARGAPRGARGRARGGRRPRRPHRRAGAAAHRDRQRRGRARAPPRPPVPAVGGRRGPGALGLGRGARSRSPAERSTTATGGSRSSTSARRSSPSRASARPGTRWPTPRSCTSMLGDALAATGDHDAAARRVVAAPPAPRATSRAWRRSRSPR